MRGPGRIPEPLTEEQRAIAIEYLTGGESYAELSKRHGIVKTTLVYWVKKYRKEMEVQENGEQIVR